MRRTEHLESDGPHPQTKADGCRLGLQVARPQRVGDEGHAGFRLGKWPSDHPAYPAPTQHTGNAANVIHVIMREHEQRDLGDPLIMQAAVDQHRIRTRIDHDCRSRAGWQQQGVALPDVAGHEDLASWRPARSDRPNRNLDDQRR